MSDNKKKAEAAKKAEAEKVAEAKVKAQAEKAKADVERVKAEAAKTNLLAKAEEAPKTEAPKPPETMAEKRAVALAAKAKADAAAKAVVAAPKPAPTLAQALAAATRCYDMDKLTPPASIPLVPHLNNLPALWRDKNGLLKISGALLCSLTEVAQSHLLRHAAVNMAGVVVVEIQDPKKVLELLQSVNPAADIPTEPDGQMWGMAGKIAASLS